MSPRPRKVTDDQLFAAAHAVMSRVGPGELTLARIAREAGVTAAVLVQRFGSKRGLLLTLAKRFSEGAGATIESVVAQHTSPLAALMAYAECMAGMAASPAAFARNLAYLQIDLVDPDFRRHLLVQARATRGAVRRLLGAARSAGELTADAPVASLARTIEAVMAGSLLTWAFYQNGSAAQWIRRDVRAVVDPYRRRRPYRATPSAR